MTSGFPSVDFALSSKLKFGVMIALAVDLEDLAGKLYREALPCIPFLTLT